MIKNLVPKSIFASVLALSLIISPAFAIGNNGSFENETVSTNFNTVIAGGTSITGWSVDTGSVDHIGSYWTASNGVQSIDLSGNEAGSISQTIPTTVGVTYKVTFDLSGNPDSAGVKTVAVSATGSAAQNYSYDTVLKANSLSDMKWEANTYTFTATSTSTTLTFASQTSGPWGPALDNVSVSVPVVVLPTPTNKDACKKGGWQSLFDENGNPFKNQGQCVSWTNHQD